MTEGQHIAQKYTDNVKPIGPTHCYTVCRKNTRNILSYI